jgi:glycosyltransferase involved in cell wall biosynthesis
MRILLFTTHLRPGGIPTYVLTLAKGLKTRGHEVVVASGGGALVEELNLLNIPHWEMPIQTKSEVSPKTLRTFSSLLRKNPRRRFDLIHAHTRVTQCIAHGIYRLAGLPYVTTWHGLYRRRLGRRLFPCTGAVTIAISDIVAQDLQKKFHVPAERIRTVINAIDTNYFSPQKRAVLS